MLPFILFKQKEKVYRYVLIQRFNVQRSVGLGGTGFDGFPDGTGGGGGAEAFPPFVPPLPPLAPPTGTGGFSSV
ncbi:MAG: hypothetical protein EB023_09985 [Flavobacteriia bacterium]|nr:hypothetical protein [Flavobacteriia bacterium]